MTARNSLLAALLCLCACSYAFSQLADDGPLTNGSIVKLVKAGFKEKTIITIIASRPNKFDLSTDQMIDLKRLGVTEKIILEMLQQGIVFDSKRWEDDIFFKQGNNKRTKSTPAQPGNGSSAEVFGSSGGGSNSSSQISGAISSNQNDNATTGNSTARIMRPPTQAATAPKLEKLVTLTNESVVELVDAGFSEGTIIRRIEQSAVDFDLTSPKLTELRKHLVTEKIITAMKIAAGEPTE